MSKGGKAHLHQLYSKPLPVHNVQPLPPLSYNPLSAIYFLYQFLFPCCPSQVRLTGILNEETRSIWIIAEKDAADLWFSGFFGKGQFSRSEPSWYTRTQRSLGLIGKDEKLTSEEITARRRIARAQMKAERAKKEKEELEATLLAEGRLPSLVPTVEETVVAADTLLDTAESMDRGEQLDKVENIRNVENLQLTFHEGIFLSLALDVIDIKLPDSSEIISKPELLKRVINLYGAFTLPSKTTPLAADHLFLVEYAVYHHYRSLGWTVKPGVKFGVDWLLYKRGPVFSHAEFSIVVLPAPKGHDVETKPWWWLHTLTRVNGQVKKTVILTYVEYDPDEILVGQLELPDLLRKFKIREVSIRRWIPSRNRD